MDARGHLQLPNQVPTVEGRNQQLLVMRALIGQSSFHMTRRTEDGARGVRYCSAE